MPIFFYGILILLLFLLFLGKLKRAVPKKFCKGESSISIQVSDYGIIIRGEKGEVQISWNKITKIIAFKRDLYVVDTICLVIEINDIFYEINEEMNGFSDLFGFMEKILSVSPRWYIDIMTPAFEANMKVIYEKKAEQNYE